MNNKSFVLGNENTLIEFEILDYVSKSKHCDVDNKTDYRTKSNKLECYYYFNSKEIGWGSVSDVTITTSDLKILSMSLLRILSGQSKEMHFKTEEKLFEFDVIANNGTYNLCFKIIDGLEDIWVEVCFDNMNKKEFEKHICVFVEWSESFPVLTKEQLLSVEKVCW